MGDCRIKHIRGFTVVEMTVVVAIIAILCAIAIPSVASLSKSLKLKELDDTAREIYLTAQGYVEVHKAEGTLASLFPVDALSVPSAYIGDSERYPDATALFVSDTDAAGKLIPQAALSAFSKYDFIIEYDKNSGNITAVFTAERGKGLTTAYMDESPSSAFTEPSISANRKNNTPIVGYYAGGIVGNITAPTELTVDMTVQNADDLTVTVHITPMSGSLISDTDVDLALTVADQHGNTATLLKEDNVGVETDGITYFNMTFMLDSYTPDINGNRESMFGSIFTNTGKGYLVPGDDLTISAVVSYHNGTTYCNGSCVKARCCNSLFAALTNGTAYIAYPRQLQNLDTSTYRLEDRATVTDAVQIADLDLSVFTSGGTNKSTFTPISNASLLTYNGGTYSISGLTVSAASGSAGLFGGFFGTKISNVTLLYPSVRTSSGSAGALAGTVTAATSGTTVTNCSIFIPESKKADAANYTVTGTTYAGGLMGCVYGTVDVNNSFAALSSVAADTTGSTMYAGGLVGYAGSGTSSAHVSMERSYADTSTITGYNTGGLLGYAGQYTYVINCYALSGTWGAGSTVKGGLYASSGSNVTATYFYTVAGYNSSGTQYTLATSGAASSSSYAALLSANLGTNFRHAVAADCTPYSAILSGMSYPFPIITGLHHYNDWPYGNLKTVYYELYDTNGDGTADSFGFSPALTINGTSYALQSGVTITKDGYAVLSSSAVSTSSGNGLVSYMTTVGSMAAADLNAFYDPATLAAVSGAAYDGNNYDLYCLPDEAVETSYAAVNQSLIVNGVVGVWTPHFAGYSDGVLTVRTARQLYNLGKYSTYYNYSCIQNTDINYITYTGYKGSSTWCIAAASGSIVQPPVGSLTAPYSGTYDGSAYKILITSFGGSGTAYAGLFGYNSGTVKNVLLLGGGSSGTTVTGSTYAGSLVGGNSGTVTNCAASGFTVSSANAGGLVGRNDGYIINSYAANYAAPDAAVASSVTGTNNAGGLVGINTGATTSCFATARLGSSVGYGFVGSDSSGTYTDCYCAAVRQSSGEDVFVQFGSIMSSTRYWLSVYANASTGAINFTGLRSLSLTNFGTATATYPYPFTSTSAKQYPYPCVWTSGSSKPFYGAWPAVTRKVDADFGTYYYEIYKGASESHTVGFYAWGVNMIITTVDNVVTNVTAGYTHEMDFNQPIKTDSQLNGYSITETGYGVFYTKESVEFCSALKYNTTGYASLLDVSPGLSALLDADNDGDGARDSISDDDNHVCFLRTMSSLVHAGQTTVTVDPKPDGYDTTAFQVTYSINSHFAKSIIPGTLYWGSSDNGNVASPSYENILDYATESGSVTVKSGMTLPAGTYYFEVNTGTAEAPVYKRYYFTTTVAKEAGSQIVLDLSNPEAPIVKIGSPGMTDSDTPLTFTDGTYTVGSGGLAAGQYSVTYNAKTYYFKLDNAIASGFTLSLDTSTCKISATNSSVVITINCTLTECLGEYTGTAITLSDLAASQPGYFYVKEGTTYLPAGTYYFTYGYSRYYFTTAVDLPAVSTTTLTLDSVLNMVTVTAQQVTSTFSIYVTKNIGDAESQSAFPGAQYIGLEKYGSGNTLGVYFTATANIAQGQAFNLVLSDGDGTTTATVDPIQCAMVAGSNYYLKVHRGGAWAPGQTVGYAYYTTYTDYSADIATTVVCPAYEASDDALYCLIRTGEQLDNISENTDYLTQHYSFRQDCSFDMDWNITYYTVSGGSLSADTFTQSGYRPIGSGTSKFDGFYDGGAYEIRNLGYSSNSAVYAGVFGCADSATLQQIHLANPAVATTAANSYAGALAGYVTNTNVIGCFAYVTDMDSLSLCNIGASAAAGGLVGYAGSQSLVTRSFAALNSVTADMSAGFSGGLVGQYNYSGAGTDATLGSCYADTVNVNGCYAGGLIGNLSAGSISGCYGVTGTLTGTNTGGLVGAKAASGVTVKSSYDISNWLGTAVYQYYTTAGMETAVLQSDLANSGNWAGYFGTGIFDAACESHPYTPGLTVSYPYPAVPEIGHYGDWPEVPP